MNASLYVLLYMPTQLELQGPSVDTN